MPATTIVTAETLRALGVPRSTAARWLAAAVARGEYAVTATTKRTSAGEMRSARALEVPAEDFAALAAEIARTRGAP